MLTKDDLARKKFAEAFITRGTKIKLNNFLPKFLHITNDGEAKPVSGFLNTESTMSKTNKIGALFFLLQIRDLNTKIKKFPTSDPYRNVLLSIEGSEFEMWWKFAEVADDKDESTKISCIPYQTQSEITIYTFSEKNIPKLLLNISRKG